jgi:hypothetical protein
MHPQDRRFGTGSRPTFKRTALAALLAGLLVAGPALSGPPPPPPPGHGGPPPPVYRDPPPVYDPGPPPGRPAPRPLPVAMRVIYAPFYVTGLILRYGVYYVLVAPLEVLGRTLDYGVEGGVEPDPGEASR